ncbi:CPBP family intramembrane glutamic endopeptidase [Enterococcus faecium]
MKNFIESILYSLSLSIISGLFVVLTMLVSKIYFFDDIFFQMSVPTIISIFLIPYMINRYHKIRYTCYISSRNIIVVLTSMCISFFVVYLVYNQSNLVLLCFHFFLVAISEEYLYRGIIYFRLSEEIRSEIFVVLISSCIFAFLGHMGEPFYYNLIYRFPLGILFGFLRVKTGGITYPIIVHAFYNIIITIW